MKMNHASHTEHDISIFLHSQITSVKSDLCADFLVIVAAIIHQMLERNVKQALPKENTFKK